MRYIKKVAVGESHCLFLLGDGSIWGVGSNEYG
jgi:alpha-tubulin suppressor-like RCC1 family protein